MAFGESLLTAEERKLLIKLVDKDYDGETLTEDEQVKLDDLWPYCVVDGCDKRFCRSYITSVLFENELWCNPHMNAYLDSMAKYGGN